MTADIYQQEFYRVLKEKNKVLPERYKMWIELWALTKATAPPEAGIVSAEVMVKDLGE